MSQELNQEQRNRNANETQRLVSAVQKLQSLDFSGKFMGSGINISLTNLNGTAVCEEFVIHAEDMEQIKPAIIESIKKMLRLRKILLTNEIESITKAIAI